MENHKAKRLDISQLENMGQKHSVLIITLPYSDSLPSSEVVLTDVAALLKDLGYGATPMSVI